MTWFISINYAYCICRRCWLVLCQLHHQFIKFCHHHLSSIIICKISTVCLFHHLTILSIRCLICMLMYIVLYNIVPFFFFKFLLILYYKYVRNMHIITTKVECHGCICFDNLYSLTDFTVCKTPHKISEIRFTENRGKGREVRKTNSTGMSVSWDLAICSELKKIWGLWRPEI